MSMQDIAWVWMLGGVALVALAFVYVISQAGRSSESTQVESRSYAIRRWWFVALIVLFAGVAYATLNPFPIVDQRAQSQTAQIVNATGRQWSWELSQNRVKAGTPVEFNVTSADVNHGFAIYSPDQRIVTQTQAMPGFTNRVVYTFTQPGKYLVRCLEYCGLAHHAMEAEIEVVAADDGGRK